MKNIATMLAILFFSIAAAVADTPNRYQVTGPVLEGKSDMIVVHKGKEKWGIARDKDTKVTSEPKVGDKVTIHYQMEATDIEVKSESEKK